MKWISKKSEVAKNVHVVELTEEEQQMSDEDLITLADNNGDTNNKGVHHFGGRVNREGKVAEIVVYTD
jgi:hypothetical protein